MFPISTHWAWSWASPSLLISCFIKSSFIINTTISRFMAAETFVVSGLKPYRWSRHDADNKTHYDECSCKNFIRREVYVASQPQFYLVRGNKDRPKSVWTEDEVERKWKTSIFLSFALGSSDESRNEKLIPWELEVAQHDPANKIKINVFINKFISSHQIKSHSWIFPKVRQRPI